MTDEQEWSAYVNTATILTSDTWLLRRSDGSGLEAAANALIEQVRVGDVSAGTDVPFTLADTVAGATLLARIGHLAAGMNPKIRFQGKNVADTTARYWDMGLDAENGVFNFYAPSTGGPTHKALNIESAGHVRPGTNGAANLGTASYPWDNVFADNSTIQASDGRLKKWRGPANDQEVAAGLEIIEELGFFQKLDAIAVKGEESARYHFGAEAQVVWTVMADHKLVDPIKNGKPGKTPFAFLCWDSWDDEFEPIYKENVIDKEIVSFELTPEKIDGKDVYRKVVDIENVTVNQPTGKRKLVRKAGDRFGINYTELALFLVACSHADITKRLSALEAAK